MTRLERIAQGLLRPINPYSTIILGVFTSLWGLWVLMPGWHVFAHAAVYSRMEEFAPEWAWGSWALITGIFIVLAVFKGMYTFLMRALGFTAWHWTIVGLMMWWGDWQNTGGLAYTFVDAYVVYAYLNIKTNYVKYGENIPHFYE